ncbi:hypothetical protein F5888DRAFT_1809320 [Russula emetica]|nr:hypothetical protein F5888DRAFT_1809320 [Russula emetica]
MATSHPLSISRPSKLRPKQHAAQACVNPVSVVACGGAEGPAKPSTSLVKSLRRAKLMKLDAIPTLNLVVPSVPSTSTKKRARKDTLDENGASGDAGGRLPRVRQRLVSTSSVATIRAHKSIEDVQGFKESSAARSRIPTDSRKASGEPLRARPFSEINNAPGDTPQRRLRRVGTIEFPTMRVPDGDSFDPSNQPSRIPVPIRRVSTSPDDDPNTPDNARSSKSKSKYVPRQSRESSSYAAAATPGPAPRASLDRFDLRVAPVKEHTELWDHPDDSLHAWPGILILTDNESSVRMPPIHAVEVECATHAYEGRFSTESNALPVFSTRFQGATFSKKELAQVQTFEPEMGIIMQEDWSDAQVRKNQWYIKFWVPIPLSLFRKKDTRMFRLRASVTAVDDRMWKKVTVYSGTVVADISHLRKHKDMDGAAARA